MSRKKYDSVPFAWLEGDPKRIWQAQISGEKNFEPSSFMGALNDLQVDPNWRDAFADISDNAGMPEFMDRLQSHFDFIGSPYTADGRWSIYHHPSLTTDDGAFDTEKALALATRHISTNISAYRLSDMEDDANQLSKIPIVWLETADKFFDLDFREQLNRRDARPANLALYEAWDFEFDGTDLKPGIPSIYWHIKESAYSLANDYGLQRWLMQGFNTNDLDVDARYDLEWRMRCIFFFDENTCYVTRAKYGEWKAKIDS